MTTARDLALRIEACRLAAQVFQSDEYIPKLWSLAVFFENYMKEGAEGTRKDFGPKKPVKLKAVPKRKPQ